MQTPFWRTSSNSGYAFCWPQPARGTATPLFNDYVEPQQGHKAGNTGSGLLNVARIAHLPQKSMIYAGLTRPQL